MVGGIEEGGDGVLHRAAVQGDGGEGECQCGGRLSRKEEQQGQIYL